MQRGRAISLIMLALLLGGCDSGETNDSGSVSSCTDDYVNEDVYAYVTPLGGIQQYTKIGNLRLRYTDSQNGGIGASFTFDEDAKSMDDYHDLMFINILTGMTVDGQPVNELDDFFTSLPWIDPNPLTEVDNVLTDDEPFYLNVVGEFDDPNFHKEGVYSKWNDSPGNGSPGEVRHFQTFLVSVQGSLTFSFCVLAGFEWTWSQDTDCVTDVYFLDDDALLINQALANGNSTSQSDPEKGGYTGYYAYANSQCDHIQYSPVLPGGGDVLVTLATDAALDFAGSSLSGGFDHDLDGQSGEFVMGAPGANASGLLNSGAAQVVSAQTGAVLHEWQGAAPEDGFGASVAVVGDLDGDGFDEILVGAPQANLQGDTSGPGYARLFSGATGAQLDEWTGDTTGQQFGASVAALGDVDQDGVADLLIGAPAQGLLNSSKAVVLSGADGSLLRTHDGGLGEMFGFQVGSAGDIDGDGAPDYFATALQVLTPATPGLVRVFSGATGAQLFEVQGEQSGAAFGFSCTNLGDITGDGLPELAVGAPLWSGAEPSSGILRVYSVERTGTAPSAGGLVQGGAVTGPAPAVSPASPTGSTPTLGPTVSVLTGRQQGLEATLLWSVSGQTAYACLGASVSAIGDFDGDRLPDLAVGAPQADLMGHVTGAGYVDILSAANGTFVSRLRGDQVYDMFGVAVAPMGDLDGDGRTELLVGVPLADGSNFNSGVVQVISDVQTTPASSWTDEGCATAGSAGLPLLVGTGTLEPGSTSSIDLSSAVANAPAALMVSNVSNPIAFMGGTLKAYPSFAQILASTSASGTISIPFPTPAGLPSGTEFWMQWVIEDTATVNGIALSNAIKGVLP